jgi:LAO/AO transport system kinase
VRTADTTLVIEAPGLGDDVQAIKAGILEIADILVVNKSDKAGADQTVRGLRAMLELGHPAAREQFVAHHGRRMAVQAPAQTVADIWLPPVLKAAATQNEGIEELVDKIEEHREHLQKTGKGRSLEARYLEIEIMERLQTAILERLSSKISQTTLAETIDKIQSRELNPQAAVELLLQNYS